MSINLRGSCLCAHAWNFPYTITIIRSTYRRSRRQWQSLTQKRPKESDSRVSVPLDKHEEKYQQQAPNRPVGDVPRRRRSHPKYFSAGITKNLWIISMKATQTVSRVAAIPVWSMKLRSSTSSSNCDHSVHLRIEGNILSSSSRYYADSARDCQLMQRCRGRALDTIHQTTFFFLFSAIENILGPVGVMISLILGCRMARSSSLEHSDSWKGPFLCSTAGRVSVNELPFKASNIDQ
jgi:hypothetical protein